jgi:hypothetical protein
VSTEHSRNQFKLTSGVEDFEEEGLLYMDSEGEGREGGNEEGQLVIMGEGVLRPCLGRFWKKTSY